MYFSSPQLHYLSRSMKTILLTFCFREVYEKVNLTWNANHTVTYQRIRNWYFDVENSNGSLEDNVVMLNIVPVVCVPNFTINLLTLNREKRMREILVMENGREVN
jgi:hypothetical protein